MKNINNKAIIAALAISVVASTAPEKQFSVRDVTNNTQLLAHGSLEGNCATHTEELAKMQAKADAKKKRKKKAKTSAVKARITDDSEPDATDDPDVTDDENSGDPNSN